MNIMSWRANFLNLEERKNILTEREDAEDCPLDIQCWEIRQDGSCVSGQNPGTVDVLKLRTLFCSQLKCCFSRLEFQGCKISK